MRWLIPKFFISVMLLACSSAFASVVVPGDGPYFRYYKNDTQYIYDADGRDVIPQLASYHETFRKLYDKSYGWKLDEHQDLILTSYRQQVANAYATTHPNIKTVWFPSGAGFLEDSATSSWLMTLDAHETAHLYQLNAKGAVPAALSTVFGNSPMLFFFVLPIFLQPNYLSPTFMVEGNAVLQESRLNQGGRLYSGEVRALVLAQIEAGQIDPTRLINDEFRFPFGRTGYLQGGYFNAHLATKHGIDKTNGFFLAQGDRWLWPFALNKTFRSHFGASYPQEIREYVRGMEGLAKKQKAAASPALSSALMLGPMNHDANRIWFLSSSGVEPPVLNVVDKKNKLMYRRQLDLPMGKVFFDGEAPLAVDSQAHDLHHISYSLYGEGNRFIEKYKGQVLTDQRAGKTVAMDATHSWYESRILLDGVPYDISHSSAILDDVGNIYYFRQNGVERVLYKNREPVFKMDGFYGKPMEATLDGTIYFIGATEYGSTLFRYKNKEISRVLSSDRVIEARMINDKEFLTQEIGADGHTIHVASAEVKPEAPAVYSYGFTTDNIVPQHTEAKEHIHRDESRYNAWRRLRYSSLEFAIQHSDIAGLGASAVALLTDPMDYHQIQLGYAGTQFRDQVAMIGYNFTKYLAELQLAYRYKEEWWQRVGGFDQTAYNQDASIGLRLPLLRYRHWDAGVGLAATYELEDSHNDPTAPQAAIDHPNDIEELYGLRTSFATTYNQGTPLGMFPWRQFSLSLTNRLQTLENEWVKKHNSSLVNLTYQHGFPYEFHAAFFGNVAWAETQDIKIDASNSPLVDDIQIPMLTGHRHYYVKNAESARLELHKVFNLRGYSARIPVGIDRLAPLLVAQGVFLDDDKGDVYPQNIFEWGVGVDLQLLMFHRQPSIMRVLFAYNTTEPQKAEKKLQWTFKKEF